MVYIAIEPPPLGTDEDLTSYLFRAFQEIAEAISKVNKLDIRNILPDRPQNGGMYYFGQIILPDITGPGFWGYEEGAWVKL
ncbi:MAG: hypothetical protein DRP85_03280 [Candidatus Makaraimicrobium thalassicum]|nr:MAG: hypothetical protein DRP85_03280 [Candidatus Omnitrophota bacterium]